MHIVHIHKDGEVMLMMTGEYKEECGTCALIAEGSTMPYSDNTCPQVTKLTLSIMALPPSWALGRWPRRCT